MAPVRPAAVERRSDAAAAAGPLAAAGLDAGARALPVEPAPQPLTAAPLTEAFGEEADEPAFAPDLPLEAPGHSAQPFNRTPPAPSWEQPDLFEEPVDAYGTPISLVETLRKGAASGAEVATDAGEDEAPAAVAPSARAATEADLEDVDLGDDADVESVRPLAAQPLPFDEDGEDEDDDEGGEPLAPSFEPTPAPLAAAPEAARASLFEAADEPQAEPEQDDEPAVAVVRAAAAVEVESEDSADALERDDTPFDSEEDLDDEDRDDGSGEAELETDEPEHDDLSDAEFEGHEGDGGAERAAEREPVQPSLFDALDAAPAAPAAPFPAAPQANAAPTAQPALPPEAEPELAAAPTDATAAEADEPEAPPALSDVVLKPAPRSTQRLKLPEATYRAGCLFLERNRVAVSMLQREFQMDFKVATEVLDQLQKAGLIGPYLGGQRRDILMTLDEWKEKVGVGE